MLAALDVGLLLHPSMHLLLHLLMPFLEPRNERAMC